MTRFTDQTVATPSSIAFLDSLYLADEKELVKALAEEADPGHEGRQRIHKTATELVGYVRDNTGDEGGIDAFLKQYDLSSEEGVLLMCIAEALLRIPDADTADRLISDKITSANWEKHLGASESLFVNASTWGLMLTGRLLEEDETRSLMPGKLLNKLLARAGEPVVRAAMRQAMRIMGHQYVMGRDIDEALKRSQKNENAAYRYSFDMLGEAALTSKDAQTYYDAYRHAIEQIGESPRGGLENPLHAHSISVKLSALHPRYEFSDVDRVLEELVPSLLSLAQLASEKGIALTMDAEEADRLELSLQVFTQVRKDPSLKGYNGLGLAVQTYQRRAGSVIDYIGELATEMNCRISMRLVKGAYWDTEVKLAQERGLSGYPVFTRKVHTDISFLACAKRALGYGSALFPQFATHNAHTLATILEYAGDRDDFEFQRLHGMGEELYAEVIDPEKYGRPCRVYAPVGSHKDLLPYLVRRLLENGANTSFVNRIVDHAVSIDDIVADPIADAETHNFEPHHYIPLPKDLFGERRVNSRGINMADSAVREKLYKDLEECSNKVYTVQPVVNGKLRAGESEPSVDPTNVTRVVGNVMLASENDVDDALNAAANGQRAWDLVTADERARILEKAADLFEEHTAELLCLCVEEAGKTLEDAIAELREAVDFLRFYAVEAKRSFGPPIELAGPTGERNTFGMRGRGIFVCISPWNFPLAIFTGQVSAALAAGNAVLAKPAEQTPTIAFRAVQLLLEAGIPHEVLHFLPGDGARIGGRAVADPRVSGVAFTGSTDTARLINISLAKRDGPIATFIAETGGQNAMFVDSSALPEQVVLDSVASAFQSAGQRCSALRVLCLQDEIADRVIELLIGHMDELKVGDPAKLSTDVGPAIDQEARQLLEEHVAKMQEQGRVLHQVSVGEELDSGTFFAPTLIELDSIDQLEREVFGPVLHVLRFPAKQFEQTVEAMNATGYGLTMGLHSRIDNRAERLAEISGAGNLYVNRNMIGAVVGVQPFGGRGLSGTGPKAGGPNYLARFGSEYTISNNISAVGGNATLLSMGSD